ncbi:MAG: hypothetical protein AB8H80_05540 [Planctomycetota bacterium]
MSVFGSRPAIGIGLALWTLLAAALATLAPLWVYAVSLAVFGLPHVLVELRYIDLRFAARIPRWALRWLLGGLLLVALLRLAAFLGMGGSLVRLELSLGIGLVAIAVPIAIARTSRAGAAIGFAVAGSLLAGVVYAPLETLVLLALLHNLTPVGFLAERLRGHQRRWAMLACAAAFAVLPACIVAWPIAPTLLEGPLATGSIEHHLHAFVPAALHGSTLGERLFAAAAFLQVMHYTVVIGILPRLQAAASGTAKVATIVPWPRGTRLFASTVVALGVAAALSFALDFGKARSGYAVFAAVHAWIEIPILLLACCAAPSANTTAEVQTA